MILLLYNNNMRLHDKQLAITLRKQGKTYNEISLELGKISKSTLSRWLGDLVLSKEEQEKLHNKMSSRFTAGLIKASQTNRNKKIKKIQNIQQKAIDSFAKHKNDPFFISGLMLYWAEGSKIFERAQFSNSDYRLIVIMNKWFRKFLDIKKISYRLYIHKVYEYEEHEKFWKHILNKDKAEILSTTFKPPTHGFKRNPQYRGCMRMDAGGVEIFHTIKFWEEEYTKLHKLTPLWCNG